MKIEEQKKDSFFRSAFLNLIGEVEKQNKIRTTSFLSLNEQSIAKSLLRSPKVSFQSFGGFASSERAMLVLFPTSFEISKEDFPCLCIRIDLRDKRKGIALPAHRDYLGAILGLGLKREKIGDIFPDETGAYVAVHEDIAAFLCENLLSIGSFAADAKISSFEGIEVSLKTEEMRSTVKSPRLDAVVASALSLSREKAALLISSEKVFLNGELKLSAHAEVKTNDLLTVRGAGRFRIEGIDDLTKKNRRVLKIVKYV